MAKSTGPTPGIRWVPRCSYESLKLTYVDEPIGSFQGDICPFFSKDKQDTYTCTKAQYPLPVREIFVTQLIGWFLTILSISALHFRPIRKQDPIHTNPCLPVDGPLR